MSMTSMARRHPLGVLLAILGTIIGSTAAAWTANGATAAIPALTGQVGILVGWAAAKWDSASGNEG